jgi:hypothetical protein
VTQTAFLSIEPLRALDSAISCTEDLLEIAESLIVVRNTTVNNRKFHIRAAVAFSDFILLMQRFCKLQYSTCKLRKG